MFNKENGILSIDGITIDTNSIKLGTNEKKEVAVVREALKAFGFNSAEEMVEAKKKGAYIPEGLQILLNTVANQLPLERMNDRSVINTTRRTAIHAYASEGLVDEVGVVHHECNPENHRRR